MNVVDRALIIRRPTNQLSQEYSKVTANTLDRCNTPYEFIDAIERLPLKQAAKAVGMKVPASKPEGTNNTIFDHPEGYEQGNVCCTASHVLAWKRIVELDTPCAILEHDAIVYRNFLNVEIADNMLFFLGVRLRDPNLYTPKSRPNQVLRIGQAVGTHAYAISPVTAKALLAEFEEHGFIWNVDHFLFMSNECRLPIIAMDPYPAACWSRNSSMMDHAEVPKQTEGFLSGFKDDPFVQARGVIQGINDQNMFGSMTPGFLEGMGIPIHYQVNR